MEKLFNILVFADVFFMQIIKLLPLMIEKMLLQKREKRKTTQGDSRAMKHFHFCLTSLKKGTGSSRKPMKNWEAFATTMNNSLPNFPSDVQHT
jgi:hypothetical protein